MISVNDSNNAIRYECADFFVPLRIVLYYFALFIRQMKLVQVADVSVCRFQ
jgi:hypothetical protein